MKNISFSVGITRNFGQFAVVEPLCGLWGGSWGPKIIIFIEIVNCGQTYCLLGTWTWIHNDDRIYLELGPLRAQASPLSLRLDKQTGTGLSLRNSPTIQPTDIIKLCYIQLVI